MKRNPLSAFPITIFSVAAQAEEGSAWDLRFSVGTAPGISKDATTNATTSSGAADPNDNTTNNLSSTYGIDIQAGARWRREYPGGFGIVVGPDLFFRSVGGTFNQAVVGLGSFTTTETLTAFGVRLVGGPTFSLPVGVRIEVTPFIEGGGATLKEAATIGGNNVSFTSNIGSYFGYGITAGAFYSFNRHFGLGAQVGYQGFTAQVKSSAGSSGNVTWDNATDTLTGSGFIGNVSAIWSF